METPEHRRPELRAGLRFLRPSAKIRGPALLACLVALGAFGCGSRMLDGAGGPGAGGTGGWVQPSTCTLPFEVGQCDAIVPVFAYVSGACVPRTYGGCDGNDNRFSTLEECLATCEGRPSLPCPSGRVSQTICVACGPAGGCAKLITACALPCSGEVACPQSLPVCYQGVCQWAGCD